jgi:tetratricopeptide (TPR) repeat protein
VSLIAAMTGNRGAPKPSRHRRLVTAVVVLTLVSWGSSSVPAAPFHPSNEAQILEHLPAAGTEQMRQLRQLRGRLADQPENIDLAVHLARLYLELGRAEADPRYYGYAQAALLPWWDRPAPPPDILLLRATLRQSRHDFPGALADLSQVLDQDPRNAQAWLTRAVILRVTGDFAEARRACAHLVRLASALISTACIADIASLNGDGERSYQILHRQFGQSEGIGNPERLWVLTSLAETAARLGDTSAAEAHFRAALSLDLRDPYLLGAYADFLLDEGRPAEARELVRDETRIDGLVLRLALAEDAVDGGRRTDIGQTARIRDLQARFEASHRRQETVHRREEAWFTLKLLRDPPKALGIALENWAVQREPWDARIVLEAALAAGDRAAAEPVVKWLAASKLQDVLLEPLVARLRGTQP